MKKILYVLAAVCCFALASCTQVQVQVPVQYGFDTVGKITCVEGYEQEVTNFNNEIQDFFNAKSGTVVTDDDMINGIDPIVAKYNGKHFAGTFYIWKENKETKLKTYIIVQGS